MKGDFKVKDIKSYKNIDISEWKSEQLIQYYYDKFFEVNKYRTFLPIGHLKLVINKKQIKFWMTYLNIDFASAIKIFKEFIDWSFIQDNNYSILKLFSPVVISKFLHTIKRLDENQDIIEFYKKQGWKEK